MIGFRIILCFIFSGLLANAQTLDSIKLSNGGGFSGQSTVYKITKKQVLKGTAKGSTMYTERAPLPCKQKKQLFKSAQKIETSNQEFNHPFNKSQSIELFSKAKSVRYTWGDPAHETPIMIQNYYDSTMIFIKTLKFKPK